MKENVLDVLMYLFETYIEAEQEPESDHDELRAELLRAGFHDGEIDRALDWLDGLSANEDLISHNAQTEHGLRIYSELETARIDAPGRGYLLYLEQIGILPPEQRELVIDRLLALDATDVDIEQIKWVVMMVLFSQPGHEQAFSLMEDLVFDDQAAVVH